MKRCVTEQNVTIFLEMHRMDSSTIVVKPAVEYMPLKLEVLDNRCDVQPS